MKDVKRTDIIGIVFLVILVVTFLSIYYYDSESDKIDTEKQEYLKAINELKIDQIVQWRKERLSTAQFFPTIGKLIKYTEELRNNKNTIEAKSYFNKSLLPFKLNHYYENIFIAEPNGSILFSLDSTFSLIEESTIQIIKQAVENDSVIFSDFYYHPLDAKIYFDLVSPVKNNDGEIIAAIIQRTEPSHSIYQLISKWPSESKSAESYIFKKLEDRIIFLSELRHKSNTKLDFTISISDTNIISVKGILGRQGKLDGTDYRGVTVLANLQKIPGTDWLIISEIDKDEIYKDIIYRIEAMIVIALITMTAMLLGYLFLKKSKQSKQFENKFLKEKELVEIQKEFKTTLYSIGDAVITSDSNGRIKYMNTVAETLTGWKESEATGLPLEKVFIIINETTREKIDNPVQKVMKQGTIVSLANHTLLISRQGKEIPIADSGAPIKDLNGNIIGVVLVFRDQTEERAKEKAILESNDKFSKIFNSSSESISLTQMSTGKLREVNDGFIEMFGYSRDEVINRSTIELGLWVNASDRERMVEEIKSTGRIKNFEATGRRKNGENIIALISGELVIIDNEQMLLLTIRDFTERKKLEAVLQNERDRISAILNLIVDPIFVKDDQHRFTFGNKAFFEMIGLDKKNVIGKTLAEDIPEDEMEHFLKVDRLVLDTGITDTREEELTINKQKRTILTSKTRLTDDSGNRFLIGSIHDITDRINAEKEKAHFNELMKFIISNTKSSVSVFDTQMNYIYVSDRYFDDFHLTDKNIIGRNHYDVFPDLPQFLRDIHKRALSGETISGEDDPLMHSDGSMDWANWTCMPWYNNDETIGGIIVYLEVITERKQAEEQIKLLAQMVDIAPGAVMIHDFDGQLFYANQRAAEMQGCTIEEFLTLTLRDIDTTENAELFPVRMEELILNGEINFEARHRRKNGTTYPVQVYAKKIDWTNKPAILSITTDISERKHAEAVLQDIIDKNPMSIQILDLEGYTIQTNMAHTKLFSVKPPSDYSMFSDAQLLKLGLGDIFESIKKGEIVYFPDTYYNVHNVDPSYPDNPVWIKAVGFPLNDSNGKPEYFVLMHENITERKLAEEKIRQMAQVSAASTDYIVIIGADFRYRFANEVYLKARKLRPEDIIGKHMIDIVGREKFEELGRPQVEAALRGELVESLETSDFRTDKLHYLHVHVAPYLETDGTITGVIMSGRDITDIMQAENQLRKLSGAVEQSTATIMITGADGTIEYVNPKFSEITGYTFEEAVGKNPSLLKSNYTSSEDYADLWKTILSGKEWRGVFYNRKKNGELYWESTVISPILNKDGKISNFVAIKEDITEQKRITEELIRSKEKAEEMNRIKSYFYANMSHELRTPFVGILGYSELLVDILTDPEHQKMAKQIFISSKRLTETLNNILNITKIEFDRIVPMIAETNLYALLLEIKSLYEMAAKQRNSELLIEYEHSSGIIHTDAKLMREVLVNLINNAIKFTSNGSIKIKVESIIEGNVETICIKVSDTGLGIPKEKQKIIWHEFRQVSEGLNRSFEGTGLGLTITKKYIEILGGNISLESEMGKGSVFTITLPVLKNFPLIEPETRSNANTTENVAEPTKQKRPHLLYVDDDIVSREFIKLVVERTDCTLDISPNADDVLRLINEKKYDGFLIDINLGSGMDGIELVKKIQSMNDYKNTPAIAITAYASDSDREEFLSNGFTHYLSKPFGVDELKSLLTNIFFS